jgi:hypothetical protein
MPLISPDEATEVLSPYLEGIHDAIHGGMADFMKLPARARNRMVAGTRAGVIHDFQVDRAALYFAKHPGKVRAHELDKLIVFDIAGRVALRFKKVDRVFKSSNQPSQQVAEFRGQIPLPGIEATSNLEAAYIYDDIEQEIEWSGIVCPNNSRAYWHMELRDEGAFLNVVDMFDTSEEEENVGTKFTRRKSGIIVPFKRDGSKSEP